MRIYGREASIEQIVSECLKDRAFYAKKGGVTLTGGEVLYQPEFAIAILKACKDNWTKYRYRDLRIRQKRTSVGNAKIH